MLNENEMTASQVHVSSLLPFIALRPETRSKGKDGANDGQRAYLLLRWSLQRHRQRHVQCHFRKGLSLWGYFSEFDAFEISLGFSTVVLLPLSLSCPAGTAEVVISQTRNSVHAVLFQFVYRPLVLAWNTRRVTHGLPYLLRMRCAQLLPGLFVNSWANARTCTRHRQASISRVRNKCELQRFSTMI